MLAAISIRGLVTRFGDQVVHDGLDLDVMPGEVIGVVGGSGTGKSVLLRTIVAGRRNELDTPAALIDRRGYGSNNLPHLRRQAAARSGRAR